MCSLASRLLLSLATACVSQRPLHEGLLPGPFPMGSARPWSVVLDASGSASLVPGTVANAAAWGSFEDAVNKTGWTVLRIHTSEDMGGEAQSYAAGFLEGSLTHERMAQHRRNVWGFDFAGLELPVAVKDFLASNMKWMRQEKSANPKDSYWQLANFLLDQARGLMDGYNTARSRFGEPKLSFDQILMYSLIDADMDDVTAALKAQGFSMETNLAFHNRPKKKAKQRHHGHCSALIQCAPGNADLFVGHATWDGYRAMIRVVKHLDMPLPGALSRRMAFSSNPGSLYSADDFYSTDTGLAIVETTIDNYNASLWLNVKPESMLTWARAMVANRLALNGDAWTEMMLRHNSGTCNNQWMVVDYKLFFPGQPFLVPGTLWVSETMPGHVRRADATGVLMAQGSWPSYNIPYFRDLWSIAGFQGEWQRTHKYGETADVYSYFSAPRALMFERARAEHTVKDFASFMEFIRYNHADDPLEWGDRCNSISSRCDLNDKSKEDYDCYGGIDAKAVRWRKDLSDLSFYGVSGPSRGVDAPPFSWSSVNTSVENCKLSQHHGHPETFDFDWYFFSGDIFTDPLDLSRSGAAAEALDADILHRPWSTLLPTRSSVLSCAVLALAILNVFLCARLISQRRPAREEDSLAEYVAIAE